MRYSVLVIELKPSRLILFMFKFHLFSKKEETEEVQFEKLPSFLSRELAEHENNFKDEASRHAIEIQNDFSQLRKLLSELHEKPGNDKFASSVKEKFCARALNEISKIKKPEN